MSDRNRANGRPVVLVAEDEFLVAYDLVETVQVAGYGVDGPYDTLEKARAAASAMRPDCAVLDIHLHDDDVFPLADDLLAANVPVIFHSGHGCDADLQKRYPAAQMCEKPCAPGDLLETIRATIENSK